MVNDEAATTYETQKLVLLMKRVKSDGNYVDKTFELSNY